MRTLTCNEIEFAHGGNGAAVLTGFFLTTFATVSLLAFFSDSNKDNRYRCENRGGKWENHPYTKEFRTPIYDAYGRHTENRVDTYQYDNWVCVV